LTCAGLVCRRRVARPYPDDRLVDPWPQGTEEGPERNCAALKRPWSANPEEAPHPETEIESTGVHEQSLQDVLVAADVRATPRFRLPIDMGEV